MCHRLLTAVPWSGLVGLVWDLGQKKPYVVAVARNRTRTLSQTRCSLGLPDTIRNIRCCASESYVLRSLFLQPRRSWALSLRRPEVGEIVPFEADTEAGHVEVLWRAAYGGNPSGASITLNAASWASFHNMM